MKTILLIVFGAVSLVVGLSFLVRALYVYKDGKRAKRVLSAIQVYTIGVFASVVLIFVPIYYTSYDFGDAYNFFRPLVIAIHNSLRIFILDGDFDIIVKSINDQNVFLRVCFSLYSAFLYVIAPILTFSNVLSLFKKMKGEIRYKWHKRKNITLCRNLTTNRLRWRKVFTIDRKMLLSYSLMFLSKMKRTTMNF